MILRIIMMKYAMNIACCWLAAIVEIKKTDAAHHDEIEKQIEIKQEYITQKWYTKYQEHNCESDGKFH